MQVVILIVALGYALPSTAPIESEDDQEAATVAHFALVRPEADPPEEETTLNPGANWLRRAKKTSSKASDAAGARKGTSKATTRGGDKSGATVTPLRRDRPKKETDPPKTRRRQLGW
ncbi:MAG TPA: hypothetical protein VHC22_09850 [Pirellulales bacterium]|nr:hypothetical protein [Pirellulales bacterium]